MIEAPAGTDRCASCHIKGHSENDCRIFDMNLKRRTGRFNLKPFDIAKRPPLYAQRLLAYLKAHGVLANVWKPGDWENFEQLLEEKRQIVEAKRAAERASEQRNTGRPN